MGYTRFSGEHNRPILPDGSRELGARLPDIPRLFALSCALQRHPVGWEMKLLAWTMTASLLAASGLAEDRQFMIERQLRPRGITDAKVLTAMAGIPREAFVPEKYRSRAYEDGPLPIGYGQTISQPYIVALMTELLDPQPDHRVLEIGTGSGYQAAVLSRLAGEVYTIEIVEPLAEQATQTLAELGMKNVHVRAGDGYAGWPEKVPFDSIIVTCAPDHIPQPLVDQLKEGGRLVIPVGSQSGVQKLIRLTKVGGEIRQEEVLEVRFVPLTRGGERTD
jgi:protein-L-isoaspartate(D-aspartate) O-methyltransferase